MLGSFSEEGGEDDDACGRLPGVVCTLALPVAATQDTQHTALLSLSHTEPCWVCTKCRRLGHIDTLEKQVAFSLGSTMEHAPALTSRVPGSPLHPPGARTAHPDAGPDGRLRGYKPLGCYLGDDDWVRQQLCAKAVQKLAPLDRIDVRRVPHMLSVSSRALVRVSDRRWSMVSKLSIFQLSAIITPSSH